MCLFAFFLDCLEKLDVAQQNETLQNRVKPKLNQSRAPMNVWAAAHSGERSMETNTKPH